MSLLLLASLVPAALAVDVEPCPPEACVPRTVSRSLGVRASAATGPFYAAAGVDHEWIRRSVIVGATVLAGVGPGEDYPTAPGVSADLTAWLPVASWGARPMMRIRSVEGSNVAEKLPVRPPVRRGFGPVVAVHGSAGGATARFLREDRFATAQVRAGLGLWTRDSYQWLSYRDDTAFRVDTRAEVRVSAVLRAVPEDHVLSDDPIDRLWGLRGDVELPLSRPGRATFVAHGGLEPVYGYEFGIGFRLGRLR